MGIKFKELFSDYREPVNLKADLRNKKVGLDAYIIIYQMLASIRRIEEGGEEFNYEGRTTSHLMGLFRRSLYFLENGIKPVAIFDGPATTFKAETLKKRAEIKKEARKQQKLALEEGDMVAAAKYAQATVKITEEIIDDSKTLFELLGIPHLTAIHDAEAQLALMTQKGIITAAASQDYDTFVFGAPRIIRNVTVSRQRRVGGKMVPVIPEQFFLNKILKGLDITKDQLIFAGLLIGTDFNDGVKGIGPKTALKIVKKEKSWENIQNLIQKNYVTAEFPWEAYFPTDPELIINYFRNPPYAPIENLQFGKVDKIGLIDFLVENRGFGRENVENGLRKVLKLQQQTSLSSFF